MKLMTVRQQTVCQPVVAIPALTGYRASGLALHSSGSYGCIAPRGGSGAPPRSGGDLTPGGAKIRGDIRRVVPPAGGRIPGSAGAPALRLERIFLSRAASGHTSPASASGILAGNAG